MIYSKQQANELLLKEYPQLMDKNVKIVKQFVSSNGRTYNAFLVETDLGMLVAKALVHEKYPLAGEWNILKKLNSLDFPSPLLVFQDQIPDKLLLTKFVAGNNASDLPNDNDAKKKIFYQVGITTGLLHSIPAMSFGELLHPKEVDWIKYLRDIINVKLIGCENILSREEYKKVQQYLSTLEPLFKKESGGIPKLIHKDLYLDNFIITQNYDKAILIDYVMTIGGMPLNDLAKFYIFELSHRPQYKHDFLSGYIEHAVLPHDFNERIKVYIYKEALGMIDFFTTTGDLKTRDHAILIINDLIDEKGIITELLK